jgi:hypothetical protein
MTTRTLERIAGVLLVAVLGVALAVEVRALPALPLVVALVVTVSAGMDLVLRSEARYRPTPDLFVLPAALVVGAVLFLPWLSSGASMVAGLTVFGLLLLAVFWAEHSIRLHPGQSRPGETALTMIGYVAAFILYAAVYQFKTRSLISAPAIIAITFLLAARQLRLTHDVGAPPDAAVDARSGAGTASESAAEPNHRGEIVSVEPVVPVGGGGPPVRMSDSTLLAIAHARREAALPPWRRTLFYAMVVALATGEVMWALNYWPLNGLLGGAFLLSVFYFLVGILTQHQQQRLTRRLAGEYAAVAAVGVLLIAAAGLFRRGV